MSPRRLFVVVSTGQGVANLPPLLEHSERGDRVVWIESDEARKRNWSEGARGVLTRFGLTALADGDAAGAVEGFAIHVKELDDLAALVEACKPAVELARRQCLRPHLILNGGPKLTPLGLLRAWGELDPVLLYGEQQPVVCKTFPVRLDRPPDIRPYTCHTLDLPEILEVRGYQVFDNEGVKFWPGPLADDLAREPYGVSEPDTAELHRQWHQFGRVPSPSDQPLRYADLAALVPGLLDGWKQALPALAGPERRELSNDGLFRTIYHATLKLAREAGTARCRAGQPVLTPIGPAFERAVARRVHAWLERAKHPAVRSAWRGVKVATRRDPLRVRAEFDILLVLTSGLLWHLECKSFAADVKDLDARLFNLQQASSQLAQMALCGPLLARHAAEDWFAHQHELREKVEERRYLTFVPFTLPGQPDKYLVNDAGVAREFSCPTLEAVIERALEGYRLPS
jgi:hypothetical protein